MSRRGFRCPFCRSSSPPYTRTKVSTAGWVLFVVLLIVCFPLCLIALLITEEHYYCGDCGMRIGNE